MKSHFDDKEDFFKAQQALVDINKLSEFKEDTVANNRKEVERAFNENEFPLNNNQLAISMTLTTLLEDDKRLLCQIGAGKGKSRIAAAIALHFLRTTQKDVYIIFPDDGLRRRDQQECQGLWRFVGKWDSQNKKRLKHIVDISKVNLDKESILIVDESDDVIMKNPKKFT